MKKSYCLSDLKTLESALQNYKINFEKIDNYCGIKGMTALIIREGIFQKKSKSTWGIVNEFEPIYRVSIDEFCLGGYYKVVTNDKVRYLLPQKILKEVFEMKNANLPRKNYTCYNDNK